MKAAEEAPAAKDGGDAKNEGPAVAAAAAADGGEESSTAPVGGSDVLCSGGSGGGCDASEAARADCSALAGSPSADCMYGLPSCGWRLAGGWLAGGRGREQRVNPGMEQVTWRFGGYRQLS